MQLTDLLEKICGKRDWPTMPGHNKKFKLLPSANEVCEGYVFTPVCQSFCSQGDLHQGGGSASGGLHPGRCLYRGGGCMYPGGGLSRPSPIGY